MVMSDSTDEDVSNVEEVRAQGMWKANTIILRAPAAIR